MAKGTKGKRATAWRKDGGTPEIEDGILLLRAESDGTVYTGNGRIFHTGVTLEIPKGCAALLTGDPTLNWERSCCAEPELLSGCAEIRVKLYNHGRSYVDIHKGELIARVVFAHGPIECKELESAD